MQRGYRGCTGNGKKVVSGTKLGLRRRGPRTPCGSDRHCGSAPKSLAPMRYDHIVCCCAVILVHAGAFSDGELLDNGCLRMPTHQRLPRRFAVLAAALLPLSPRMHTLLKACSHAAMLVVVDSRLVRREDWLLC